jgi:protein-tyrosine phosphatase
MKTELYWVPGPWPGRLAMMPRPRGGDWLEVEVQSWRRSGVDLILSLLTPDEIAEFGLSDEADLSAANAIQFDSLPIADRSVPSSRAAFTKAVTGVVEQLGNGKTVAVHCRQGIGRAPLIAIGALVLSGIDPEAAIQRVSAARGSPVPETPEQRRWILDLAKSLAAPISPART